MLKEAIYHRPKQNWAYGYDNETVHVRIRTKRGDVERVDVIHGDKCMPWSAMETEAMRIMGSDELFDYWEAAVEPLYRRLCYGFILTAGDQQLWYTEKGFSAAPPAVHLGLFEYPCLHSVDILKPPAWVKDAIFYQLFTERFANGDPSISPDNVLPWGGKPEYDNFFGGDLQGVIDHLDHLTELGINAIYFNPLFAAPANHKYDTGDYMRVDPHFGTNETLRTLVDACHARGIRVMLDAVFNHCGVTFAPFVDVMEKGEASEYSDWFHIRKWPLAVEDGIPTYETFAFEATMPKFNTENPQVKAYLLSAAKYWIEEIGIDGWRLDVANEVDHQFWREFRAVVKRANPEAYILGEVWHDSLMWLLGDQFDGVMNYPLTNATLDFFVFGHMDAVSFADTVSGQLAGYPKQASEACFNLLGSHDTVRLLTLCGNDKRRMKLAVLFQFTFAGAPCIYYGDEIGLNGEFDPDNRKCMEWDVSRQDRELFAYHQSVIALRKKHSALRTGAFRILLAEENGRRIAYERSDGQERIIVMMNPSEEARTVPVMLPAGEWKDGFSGELVSVSGGSYSDELTPYEYRVLVSEI
ncbi:Cyclomaltodextrinase [Paenibacillus plantiphilus]|uniref:Cyclomaltodextrinase n=1 Tax=Paenibacillus plantiphilus TaxID=2905650 RepID=A0ABM9CH09_9BACL|nr:alpha-glycosidase [Paenibacillus plantiphilus]CAH1211358.1 Cyclomaltodextrinase [Paenibacillus plantiphilus]